MRKCKSQLSFSIVKKLMLQHLPAAQQILTCVCSRSIALISIYCSLMPPLSLCTLNRSSAVQWDYTAEPIQSPSLLSPPPTSPCHWLAWAHGVTPALLSPVMSISSLMVSTRTEQAPEELHCNAAAWSGAKRKGLLNIQQARGPIRNSWVNTEEKDCFWSYFNSRFKMFSH